LFVQVKGTLDRNFNRGAISAPKLGTLFSPSYVTLLVLYSDLLAAPGWQKGVNCIFRV